jgi:hypothetical protein
LQPGSGDTPEMAAWHPRVRRLHAYWQQIHPPEGGLPGRRAFDPCAIPDLLPGVWLLDIAPAPFRLRYRLVGTSIVEAIGREVTGLWLDEAHSHLRAKPRYFDRYRRVSETGSPSWRKGKPQLWTHRDFGTIENLLLPLAKDGSTVDMLCAFSVLYRNDGSVAS